MEKANLEDFQNLEIRIGKVLHPEKEVPPGSIIR